ncbi:Cadmium efflux system accessory protein [Geobacillus proteiniphilus]|uniref:Cadmium efflux system accessory protein n=2 Tax=Geobacillus proteiniphilus TaxID=860353 RepID=A0A1Q5T7J0_9BACL|nr:Cadmium efflux system accessory protein [Geobacillus proteiniphilus]
MDRANGSQLSKTKSAFRKMADFSFAHISHSNEYLNIGRKYAILYSNKHLNVGEEREEMHRDDVCDIYCYDEEKVERVQRRLRDENIAAIVPFFKALADENRAKIVYALCGEEELCVCDLANVIGATVATASHHLRILYKQGIVKYRKEGKLAFYSLDDDHIRELLLVALAHQKEGDGRGE